MDRWTPISLAQLDVAELKMTHYTDRDTRLAKKPTVIYVHSCGYTTAPCRYMTTMK